MNNDHKTPLEGAPSRQAYQALEGYLYQVWRTLDYWLSISHDDVLFVECAEDIDLRTPQKTTAIQVKHTAGSITLRSQSVVDAINHFWQHSTNHDTPVHFRLLTTSSRGIEQGGFFERKSGLDYWESCKGTTDLTPLITFLTTKIALNDSLREFLTESDADTIRNSLIRRIDWDTETDNIEEIRSFVDDKVLKLGYPYSLYPDDCRLVRSALLEHITLVATREKPDQRKLTFTDLLKLLEESATERVSKTVSRMLHGSPQGHRLEAPDSLSSDISFRNDKWPPQVEPSDLLPTLLAPRKTVVKDVIDLLSTTSFAVLTGISGVGKSVIALLAIQQLGGEWRHISLRGQSSEPIQHALQRLYADWDADVSYNILIDDLTDIENPALWEQQLLLVLQRYLRLGSNIIITAYNALPQRVTSAISTSRTVTITVPHLTMEDIEELVGLYDCPPNRTTEVATHIHMTTAGHPQLVHSRIIALTADNWDLSKQRLSPSTPEEVKATLNESLRTFHRTIRDDDARTLAYRLSIFFSSVQRHNIVSIAQVDPLIPSPMVSLALIVGPFVEKVDSNRYQLSPLLQEIAKENFSEEKLEELHTAAAESYFGHRMYHSELSSIFRHAIEGKSEKHFMLATHGAQSASQADWEHLYPHLVWLTRITPSSKKLPLKIGSLSLFAFRMVQLRIAESVHDSEAVRSIADWELSDVTAITDRKSDYERFPDADSFLSKLRPLFLFRLVNTSGVLFRTDQILELSKQCFAFGETSVANILGETETEDASLTAVDNGLHFIKQQLKLSDSPFDLLCIIINELHDLFDKAFSVFANRACNLIDQIWYYESEGPHLMGKLALNGQRACWLSMGRIAIAFYGRQFYDQLQ